MGGDLQDWFVGRSAVIATMHAKEAVIAPLLQQSLGVQVMVPQGLNTDTFGTFTREVDRPGTQVEAARRKAETALELTGADIAVASEGSFGPHPLLPWLPGNREIVLFLDRKYGLEVIGEDLSTETNYRHQTVRNFEQAWAFARQVGFPDHGLVVMVQKDSRQPSDIYKGIREQAQLQQAVAQALRQSSDGTIHLETDMRAMHNPTRMRAIARATRDLVQKLNHRCPQCAWPGFARVERKRGLPCGLCGLPTDGILADLYCCTQCQFTQKVPYPQGMETADPAHCPYCNP